MKNKNKLLILVEIRAEGYDSMHNIYIDQTFKRVLICSIKRLNQLMGMKYVKICEWFISKKYMSNFHILEVVGRGSETQLQVAKN